MVFLCVHVLWSRLIANYITFAVGEVLLLILTICSLAAIFPRVSYNTFLYLCTLIFCHVCSTWLNKGAGSSTFSGSGDCRQQCQAKLTKARDKQCCPYCWCCVSFVAPGNLTCPLLAERLVHLGLEQACRLHLRFCFLEIHNNNLTNVP